MAKNYHKIQVVKSWYIEANARSSLMEMMACHLFGAKPLPGLCRLVN